MNKYQLASVMGDIDDRFVSKTTKRAANKKPLLRSIAAAAAALLIVAGAAFGISRVVGIGEAPKLPSEPASKGDAQYEFLADVRVPKDAVLPPSQLGTIGHVGYASNDKLRDLKDIYEESDAVCIVTIRNWLGENEATSWYEATVERTYKGETADSIVIYQTGNSVSICNDAPLFTYGDRLLVGLCRWESRPYENAYFAIGGDTTTAYVQKAKDGKAYVIDPEGRFSYETENRHPELEFTAYGEDEGLAKELFDGMRGYDKVMADKLEEWFDAYYSNRDRFANETCTPHVYSLAEIEEYFAGLE